MLSKNPSECGTPFDIQHTSFFYDELLLVRDQPSGLMIHTPATTRDSLFALHPRAISSIRNVRTRHVRWQEAVAS